MKGTKVSSSRPRCQSWCFITFLQHQSSKTHLTWWKPFIWDVICVVLKCWLWKRLIPCSELDPWSRCGSRASRRAAAALWALRRRRSRYFWTWEVDCFLLQAPLSNFHGNKRGPASDAVSRSSHYIYGIYPDDRGIVSSAVFKVTPAIFTLSSGILICGMTHCFINLSFSCLLNLYSLHSLALAPQSQEHSVLHFTTNTLWWKNKPLLRQ